MLRMIKRLPNATGILSNAAYCSRHKLNHNNDELVFIHIGKCAGSSVKTCLTDSHFVRERFNIISIFNSHNPPIKRKATYFLLYTILFQEQLRPSIGDMT